MDVTDSVKHELNQLADAIEFTKNEAQKVGKYYRYDTINEGSFVGNRSVTNCAEIWAAREAILDGAKFIDLTFQSVKSIDGSDMPMCKNCQHTFIEYMKQLLGEKR
ncbi:MAG: hypothetical protein MSH15_09065 [Oscillospiraceae bacterium]|nr:hypothetical protein [Oscillospiraceae bacterium]